MDVKDRELLIRIDGNVEHLKGNFAELKRETTKRLDGHATRLNSHEKDFGKVKLKIQRVEDKCKGSGWVRNVIAIILVAMAIIGAWASGAKGQPGPAPDSKFSDSTITLLNATPWRMFYSNVTSTAIQELIFGSSGQVLTSAGASAAPTWETPSAGGALTYFTEADDNDTSVFTASGGNTTVGFNDNLTMQGNDITGVGVLTQSGNHVIDDGTGASPSIILRNQANQYLDISTATDGGGDIFSVSGVLRLKAGDPNDYLSISTASNDVTIEVIASGSGDLTIKAGGGDIDFDDDNVIIKKFTLYTGGDAGGTYDTTDAPTDGQQMTWSTGGVIDWQDAGGGGAFILAAGDTVGGTTGLHDFNRIDADTAVIALLVPTTLRISGVDFTNLTGAGLQESGNALGTDTLAVSEVKAALDLREDQLDDEAGLYAVLSDVSDFVQPSEVPGLETDATASAAVGDTINARMVKSVTGNTETRIAVTYNPSDSTYDFVVDDMTGGAGGNWTDSTGFLVGWGGVAKSVVNDTNYFRFEGSSEFDTTSGEVSIADDAIVPDHLVDSNVQAQGDFVMIAASNEFSFKTALQAGLFDTAGVVDTILKVLTEGGYLTAEVNNLETDGAVGIATTEIYIGTGAGTGAYAALSGDVTMDNAGDVTITSVDADVVLLNEIGDPGANSIISMGSNDIKWQFSNPNTDGFNIEGIGAFSSDLLHVHQHTGNPGAVHLAHFEAEDPDVLALCVIGPGRDSVAGFSGGAVYMDSGYVDGILNADSIAVTGDIAVSGTVDGVDVAALNTGVAADSMAWNATADALGTAIDSTKITNASVAEDDLTISNGPTDEYVMTWEADAGTGGQMTWEAQAGGGNANKSDIRDSIDAWFQNKLSANNTETGIAVTYQSGDSTIDFEVTLGTSISTAEIENDAIYEIKLNVSNAPTDNYILSYNSGATNFTWVRDTWEEINGSTRDTMRWIDPSLDTSLVITPDGSGNVWLGVGEKNGGLPQTLHIKADTFDISGDVIADFAGNNLTVVSGVLDVDVLDTSTTTINHTQWDEHIKDNVGDMVTGNTEKGIVVTYDDADNTLDFVITDTLHFIFAMSNPNALYDTDVRFCFKPVLPSAITITRIDVTCNAVPTTEPAMSLKYADAFIGLANATTIDVITTTDGVTTITSGFDDATVATGKALYFEFTADPEAALKSITVDVAYTVD